MEIFFVRNCPHCPRIALSRNYPTPPYFWAQFYKIWTEGPFWTILLKIILWIPSTSRKRCRQGKSCMFSSISRRWSTIICNSKGCAWWWSLKPFGYWPVRYSGKIEFFTFIIAIFAKFKGLDCKSVQCVCLKRTSCLEVSSIVSLQICRYNQNWNLESPIVWKRSIAKSYKPKSDKFAKQTNKRPFFSAKNK